MNARAAHAGGPSDSGGIDEPVVGVGAVELDEAVEVRDDLVEVLDKVIVRTPSSTNCFGGDVNR